MDISHRVTERTEVPLDKINSITERVIGCCIEVHKQLGPGLLESIYESALCVELETVGLSYRRQVPLTIFYKAHNVGDLRLDLHVEDCVLVEIKSVERMDPVFDAQVLTYLKISGKKVGLLLNFNSRLLSAGIKRFIL